MKTTMMIAALSTMMTSPAALASVVEKDLGTSGNWKIAQIADHDLWKTRGCVAFVKATGGNSQLELYAQHDGGVGSTYTEPTIQVVVNDGITGFVRGTMTDDRGVSAAMTLATNQEVKPGQGLLVKLGDRAKAIDIVKAGSVLSVQLLNPKGKLVKTLSFSLKGSSKGVDTAMSACQLPAL